MFNESDQAVEQWFLPQFPEAKTNDNKNANIKKTDNDLLSAFTAKKKFRMDSEQVPNSPIFTPPYYRLYLCYIYDLCKMHWWAAPGHSGISQLSLISWKCNLITEKDNNQIRLGNQNNCQNHILSTIVYHKDKPNPLFPPEKIWIHFIVLSLSNKSGL